MDAICAAVFLSFSWLLARAYILPFVKDLQTEIKVCFSFSHLLTDDFFFIEEENIAVSPLVEHILISTCFPPVRIVFVNRVEDNRVWSEKGVCTPISILFGMLPVRENADKFGVAGCVWFLLLELTITVFYKSKLIIFYSFLNIGFAGLISLKLVEIFCSIDPYSNIITSFGDRFDDLYCYEAIWNFRILDALHISIFNLCEGDELVVFLVKLAHDVFHELFLICLSLFMHVKIFVEEELGLFGVA